MIEPLAAVLAGPIALALVGVLALLLKEIEGGRL